jgi:hypothetical protein
MTMRALREVVALGGLALQSEDCAIRAAVHHRLEHGGLARIENERHHQFIIWRAVLPIWHAELEKHRNTDLTLNCDDGRHYFELKNWTGATGERQLPAIQKDVDKLQPYEHRYIIITSINPKDDTEDNISFLLRRITGLDDSRREEFRFGTVGRKGEPFEFWIAGWPVLAVTSR